MPELAPNPPGKSPDPKIVNVKMKKIFSAYLTLVLSCVFFISCSRDEGTKGIIGSWELEDAPTSLFGDYADYIRFDEDGTFYNIHRPGNRFSTKKGKWSREGDVITTSGPNLLELSFEIVELDSNTLKIRYKDLPWLFKLAIEEDAVLEYKRVSNNRTDKFI